MRPYLSNKLHIGGVNGLRVLRDQVSDIVNVRLRATSLACNVERSYCRQDKTAQQNRVAGLPPAYC
jgi:hypothetical protein